MKAAKVWILMGMAAALMGITATRVVTKRSPEATDRAELGLSPSPTGPVATTAVSPAALPVAQSARSSVTTSPSPDLPEVSFTSHLNSLAKPAPVPAVGKAKEPPQDPVARVALAFVGADPDAEAYWCEAINDPNLSEHERSDLIEDLNEDGLSDPKRPTLEDLPLILNRLRLIQELAPEAMDQVNLDAFAEAYKDLLNLADLALGGGQPVR